ncbi:MAG: hypothetical protein ACFFCT_06395 [Candidatus Odinarchaeota archaeon]
MGMKEKRKEKPREKASQEPESAEIVAASQQDEATLVAEPQSHTPEVVVEDTKPATSKAVQGAEVLANETEAEEQVETFIVLTPAWGGPEESEWMYGIPPREEDKTLWAEEWSDYLLQWTEQNEVHVLSLAVFISEPPFKDLRNKVDSFKMIAQVLIDKEVAEWSDKRKRQLRIYWKPLEDWADIVYDWSLRTGKLRLDVKSIVIQESRESFAKLPENDLYIVMALMVEKGFAEWIDKKKGAILIDTQ